jgi:hypothetical protein
MGTGAGGPSQEQRLTYCAPFQGAGVESTGTDWRGSSNAAIKPISPTTPIVASAMRNGSFPSASDETRIDPPNAVPIEDPRFETLRDNPEISPWSFSGKLD